jgi:cupin superfamily acireductone dioxygenase involved in methionine salvage
MHPKSIQRSIDHLIALKASKKTLQIRLFFDNRKWIFICGPDQLIIEKRPKESTER